MFTLKDRQMGKVLTTLSISNAGDREIAARGMIPEHEVRSLTLDNILVDTGATLLCLPSRLIEKLGLRLVREVDVATATGYSTAKIFGGVTIGLCGREGTFDCLELPGGKDPLIGVIPLEALGLEPDLLNQQLRVLPEEGKNTYLTIL
jgi:predicted aspartyl protease